MVKVTVNKEDCLSCGVCASICPAEAITMVNDFPTVDQKKCIECNSCGYNCPTEAIKCNN